LLLESPDRGSLVTRQYLGVDIIDAERAGDGCSGGPAVPCEEQHADAEVVERRDGTLRGRANPVGDRDETEHPAIRRHVERGLRFRPQPLGFALEARRKASRPSLLYCGDDSSSKRIAAELIRDVGFDPVDAGPLRIARYTEPFALLVAQLAYEGKGGPDLAYRFERLGK